MVGRVKPKPRRMFAAYDEGGTPLAVFRTARGARLEVASWFEDGWRTALRYGIRIRPVIVRPAPSHQGRET